MLIFGGYINHFGNNGTLQDHGGETEGKSLHASPQVSVERETDAGGALGSPLHALAASLLSDEEAVASETEAPQEDSPSDPDLGENPNTGVGGFPGEETDEKEEKEEKEEDSTAKGGLR